jgi:Transcriptional regulatory protein, C terminal
MISINPGTSSVLASNAPQVVSGDVLAKARWGAAAPDNSVQQAIAQLRKTLGRHNGADFIETVALRVHGSATTGLSSSCSPAIHLRRLGRSLRLRRGWRSPARPVQVTRTCRLCRDRPMVRSGPVQVRWRSGLCVCCPCKLIEQEPNRGAPAGDRIIVSTKQPPILRSGRRSRRPARRRSHKFRGICRLDRLRCCASPARSRP